MARDNYSQIMKDIANEKNPLRVELTDEIQIGCNHCGNCCINSCTRLTAFDIYNISKELGEEECMKHVEFYFGNNSSLPLMCIKNNASGMCPYLITSKDGDFVCKIEDIKPLPCEHSFVAIGTAFTNNEFSFVPLDKEVQPFDIDKFLQDMDIFKSRLYYLQDRIDTCNAEKHPILVSEYMKRRIQYQKESNLAMAVSMLLNKWVNMKEFLRLLKLSEESTVNIHNPLLSEKNSYAKLAKSMFLQSYFYMDIESKDDFITQTIKHIKHLESMILPTYRLLYKYIREVYALNEQILHDIIETDDEELAQKRFDSYFMNNKEAFMERFGNVLPRMFEEAKNIRRGAEDDDSK